MNGDRFRDRKDAGQRLSGLLDHYGGQHPIVVALPRGGVPLGYEVAKSLEAPLEVLVVRKLGTPERPELAMGAIGPGGLRVLNDELVAALDISDVEIAEVEAKERGELETRNERFRRGRPFPDIEGRTVILVDDGIATGSTVEAAIQVLRKLKPQRLVLATAVLPPDTLHRLQPMVDDLVYLSAPEPFIAVGQWFEDFAQTSSEEVVELLQRAGGLGGPPPAPPRHTDVDIPVDDLVLHGTLDIPRNAKGVVIFAHGSGSSRFSPRNQAVAETLRTHGLGTLLFDLLSDEEEARDRETREHRFDLDLLATRLSAAGQWARARDDLQGAPLGYFGSSTGGGAAIMADARTPGLVAAVVSRGGRPDLAGDDLPRAVAPTLLIVGGQDPQVIKMNQDAVARMRTDVRLKIVQGATHLFEEPGALDEVSRLTGEWFVQQFTRATVAAR